MLVDALLDPLYPLRFLSCILVYVKFETNLIGHFLQSADDGRDEGV